jgi:hypothetical protein
MRSPRFIAAGTLALALGLGLAAAAEEWSESDLDRMTDSEIAEMMRADQPVFILRVLRSGVAHLVITCNPPQCTTTMPDGLEPGPNEFYSWQKYQSPGNPDPCITWRSSSGTIETRCWE